MEKERRLEVYKQALKDYRLSLYFRWLKEEKHTDYGFCTYFAYKKIAMSELPELLNLKPFGVQTGGFWYPSGHLWTRIDLLKIAIKDCETGVSLY